MRIKLIALATVVAALTAGAAISNAGLQSQTSVKVTLKKAGAPGKVRMILKNDEPGILPQRISKITIASKTAKWNKSGVAATCTSPIPTNAAGNNNAAEITPACPAKSKVGKGTFVANTGETVGGALPSELARIDGTVNVYNYKPQSGDAVGLLFEIKSDIPVQNAHQYQYAGITRSGVLSASVPNTADLPPQIQQFLVGRTTSLNTLDVTLTSPKVKKGKKPFFTLKSTSNLDFDVQLQRD